MIQLLNRLIRKLIASGFGIFGLYQRRRIRGIMRGYRTLRQSGNLIKIGAIKQALTDQSLNISSRDLSPTFNFILPDFGELIVRRCLLMRLAGLNLNRALLISFSKKGNRVIFPLPKVWREVLITHGVQVSHFYCAILWYAFVCVRLFHGIAKLLKIAVDGSTATIWPAPLPERYVHFANLGPGNLPQGLPRGGSNDVISWYLQWPGGQRDISMITHSVPNAFPVEARGIRIVTRTNPLPNLDRWREVVRYIRAGLGAAGCALFDCLRGRWWHALLLSETAEAALAGTVSAESLAKEYLFNTLYRPLWTYEAERRGAIISYYFYSTNNEAFKRTDGYPTVNPEWRAIGWQRYLVWDAYQVDFVRRAVGENAHISIVGNIWFQDNSNELPTLPANCFAVFDVQPMRDSLYRSLGIDTEYYTPETAIAFLQDIEQVLRESNYPFALKRKRDIGKHAHPAYRRYVESLGQSRMVVTIDPGIAASRLIADCVAVISMPFTSVSLSGVELGKPSVFYDPTGLVKNDDRAAHGIQILVGREELRVWVNSLALK